MINRHKQQGMTLIEIMISLLIGAFLVGGVLQVFTSTRQTYRMQENLSRMQEDGRFAMDFLIKDIRMADYWGCLSQATDIESNLNLPNDYASFASGIAGQNDDNGGNDADADNDENGNGIWDGTDSMELKGGIGTGVFVVNIPASPSANLKVTDNSGLQKNDIVLVSDCSMGDIFQITNDPGTGGAAGKDEVIHNTGAVSAGPGNFEKPFQKKYGTDAEIFKLQFITYSIQNGANGQPALFKKVNTTAATELIESIDNMQILYGEDTDTDGSPNYYVPAGTAGLNMDQVISIRISLLVRSIDDNVASEPRDYTYNGATTTPTDRRLRRVFSSTIAVRNRLP